MANTSLYPDTADWNATAARRRNVQDTYAAGLVRNQSGVDRAKLNYDYGLNQLKRQYSQMRIGQQYAPAGRGLQNSGIQQQGLLNGGLNQQDAEFQLNRGYQDQLGQYADQRGGLDQAYSTGNADLQDETAQRQAAIAAALRQVKAY